MVGGDFANDKDTTGNCVISKKGFSNWTRPATPPHGYRSCVEYISDKKMITCGTSGVDISEDGGNNLETDNTEGFHVVQKAKKGNAVFLAGGGGRIAKIGMVTYFLNIKYTAPSRKPKLTSISSEKVL